ncbi:MAG: hypothetical protein M3O50_10905 [Myxococcota bacterium]|nr:hypothetical protein [Myxococcota bacterium]
MSERCSLGVGTDDSGLLLEALGLWLDPAAARPIAFVSHAHATRATDSACVLASPETIAIARKLGAPLRGARPIAWGEAIELPIANGFGGGKARLSLAPAGHMLGAAQLVIEHPGGRLVYAGDWSPHADATHSAGVAVACDELIITAAFALPIFRFDAYATTLGAIVDFCSAHLDAERTPVVLAQSPGPAQAIARELLLRGLPVAAEESVRRAAGVYESLGVSVGSLREDVPGQRGAVVVAPAGARPAELRSRRRAAVAYASGWALLDAALEQKRADAGFALPDQADHDGLLALVRSTGASRVYASYGDASAFAHVLGANGVEASGFDRTPIDERRAS